MSKKVIKRYFIEYRDSKTDKLILDMFVTDKQLETMQLQCGFNQDNYTVKRKEFGTGTEVDCHTFIVKTINLYSIPQTQFLKVM